MARVYKGGLSTLARSLTHCTPLDGNGRDGTDDILSRMPTFRCMNAVSALLPSAVSMTWKGTEGLTLEKHHMVSHFTSSRV